MEDKVKEIQAKEYPQFGLSMKVGNDGATYLFKDCCARQSVIDELEKGMETQDDIEYHTFDVPVCPCCVAESEVE
tara:strand:- start:458 stop:682 length:225 start_codon:yes stop_codon:yes gene_type:complete